MILPNMEIPGVQEKMKMVELLLNEPQVVNTMRRVDDIGFINNPFAHSYVVQFDGLTQDYFETMKGLPVFTEHNPVDGKGYFKFIVVGHEMMKKDAPLAFIQIEKPTYFDKRMNYIMARTITPDFLASRQCMLYDVAPKRLQVRTWHYLNAARMILDRMDTIPEDNEHHLPQWATAHPSLVFRNIDRPDSLFCQWPEYYKNSG